MKVLLVANQTLGGAELAQHLSELHAADPALSLHVLVPASVVGVIADPTEMLSLIAVDVEAERREAAARLDTLLAWLRRGGVEATGEITVAQPLLAVATATRAQVFDRVVLSTFAPGVSRWLRMDLAHRVRRVCELPVTTIVNSAGEADLPELGSSRLAAAAPATAPLADIVVVAAEPRRRGSLRRSIEGTSVPSVVTECSFAELPAVLAGPASGERAVVVWLDADGGADGATEAFEAVARLRGEDPGLAVSMAVARNEPEWRERAHQLGASFFVLADDATVNAELFEILTSEFVALRRLPPPV